jgi:hypothetical protein
MPKFALYALAVIFFTGNLRSLLHMLNFALCVLAVTVAAVQSASCVC